MDKPAFFKTGDDLQVPSGLSLHPGLKCRPVASVAHGRSGHHANLVCSVCLHRPLEALQCPQRGRHSFRRDQSGIENTGSKPRHLAVFMQRLQLVRYDLRNLQPAGIGTDIDSGKGRHTGLRHTPKKEFISRAKIHDYGGAAPRESTPRPGPGSEAWTSIAIGLRADLSRRPKTPSPRLTGKIYIRRRQIGRRPSGVFLPLRRNHEPGASNRKLCRGRVRNRPVLAAPL